MTTSRRALLWRGVSLVAAAAIPLPARAACAPPETLVEMRGMPRGERVWFAPIGVALAPGGTIRFTNRDPGNSHTATTYHPSILDRPLRIPKDAAPWDSGLLLEGGSFAVTLTVPGVYDIYCQPHEMAGMVARLVVGRPGPGEEWQAAPVADGDLPEAARAAFPAVADILARGAISPEG